MDRYDLMAVAGVGCLCAAAWMVAPALGVATVGMSLLLMAARLNRKAVK